MAKKIASLEDTQSEFVPALRFKWATRLYDGVMHRFGRDERLRRLTVQAIAPQAGEEILDFGCGTGSLTRALNWASLQAPSPFRLTAYDIDPAILKIAQTKLAGGSIGAMPEFKQVDIAAPQEMAPEEVGKYDVVTSSLVFHHLNHEQKKAAFQHAERLLSPTGRLVLVDWGPGSRWIFNVAFWFVRLLDGFAVTRDNAAGRLPEMMVDAGFKITEAKPLMNTMFGTVWLYTAHAPSS
jgi:ubiquinone/menaquinone biosynthesis C-methylase UbiE